MPKLEDFKVAEIKKMISKYNKEVKITTSGLKKADLIKKIREHPRLTVTESDKGVSIKVNSQATMGGKKIKIKKDEKPAAEGTKPKAQLGQSGIGKKRKRVEGPPKKKKIIDVAVKKEKPKPKVPTITITEADKPKKKVIKRGGRYITVKPKEHKADKMDIPKPKAKIRIAPKKEEKKKEAEKKEPKKEEEAGPVEPKKINFEKLADEIKDNIIKDPSKVYYKDYANELSKKYKPLKFKLSTSSAVLTSGKDTDFIEIIIKNKKDVVFKKSIGFAANNKDMKKISDFRMERKGTIKLFKKRATPSERETLSNIKGEEEKYQYANKILQKNKSPKKKEKLEDFVKSEFTKVEPSFEEDTVESLTKAIEHQKKQGNDEIVEKLQNDLKKLKGKGKAVENQEEKEKIRKLKTFVSLQQADKFSKHFRKYNLDFIKDKEGNVEKVNLTYYFGSKTKFKGPNNTNTLLSKIVKEAKKIFGNKLKMNIDGLR